MPELPEVETVARYLDGPVRGRIITTLKILDPKLRAQVEPRRIAGSSIVRAFRRGTLVVWELQSINRLM